MIAVLILLACRGEPPPEDGACNGEEAYCQRPYNELAQVCTHNAYATEADGFVLPTPNQRFGLSRQLDDGVRCLMLDTYEVDGELMLCHGLCGPWGERPLSEGLGEVAAWLRDHPRDIVTFILEAYISERQTLAALEDAGLDGLLYDRAGPPGSPWPTVEELITAGQRLVVFTDDDEASGGWHLDWRRYGWETPYDDPEFPCVSGRGDPAAYDNQIFILNHYTLCELGGCEENAQVNNAADFSYDRARRCWLETPEVNAFAQIPTFINVDYYDVPDGAIFQTAARLNADWPGAE